MLTRTRIAATAALVLAAPLALSACTFTSTTTNTITVPAAEIATLAEDTLEDQIGHRPEIDCGAADIEFAQGDLLTCLLTDPANGQQFDTDITFTSVEGTAYSIDIQVAETPN